ncbi:MAG TPA: SGNH/GDSL hydrolase family protein [Kiritimatiellia bacterium]|jgi:lysophospholipase L1-like esterase|nr:SGNH/GDSL hydrolase family protein [Kiritimatiellia bacterium]
MKNATIVLFGDSYTAGRIPHSQTDGAFKKCLSNVHGDFAVSGSTALQWSMENECLPSVCLSDADIAVGSLLGNDVFAALADGKVTLDETLRSMAALAIVLSRIAHTKPVLLMLYPNPYMGVPDKHPEAAEGVRRLNAAIGCVADVINASIGNHPVMPLDLGTVLRPEHFDGVDIHPNEAGYQAMAAAVMDVIGRM